jgi:hypothetical protein
MSAARTAVSSADSAARTLVRKAGRAPGKPASVTPISAAQRRPVGTFCGPVESFKRSLLAENKSQHTVRSCGSDCGGR